ncbi:MAG: hypothetical protein V3V05_03470 [Pontiella sp.]
MKRINHILLAVLLCGSYPVMGKVFREIGVADGRLNTAGLPWGFAYKTKMNVNGQQTDLYVYSARFNEPVVAQLKDQFEAQGAKVVISETKDGAQGLATWDDRKARILVLSPDSQPNQMVFIFYPEPGKGRAPRLPIPEYPSTSKGKTVMNEDSGSMCRTIETEDRPEQVQTFYAGALPADGWSMVIPPGRGLSSMAVYQKKDRICSILATYRSDGPNRVTLLVKGGGL